MWWVWEGAAFAVLLTLLGTSTGIIGAWWAGPLGAIGAATVVVLAAGGLGTHGQRFLVVGIGVSALLSSLVELAMSTQDIAHATALYTWTIGSLTGRGYAGSTPLMLGLALLLPIAALAGQRLALLRFDAELAQSLGLNVFRTRLAILAIAVVLAGRDPRRHRGHSGTAAGRRHRDPGRGRVECVGWTFPVVDSVARGAFVRLIVDGLRMAYAGPLWWTESI